MKKTILLFILLIILLPISLLAQTGKVAGKITNVETGEPIEGVSVFLEESQIGTYTKANGTYIMKVVPVGEHTINVRLMKPIYVILITSTKVVPLTISKIGYHTYCQGSFAILPF